MKFPRLYNCSDKHKRSIISNKSIDTASRNPLANLGKNAQTAKRKSKKVCSFMHIVLKLRKNHRCGKGLWPYMRLKKAIGQIVRHQLPILLSAV